jgi:hypothetical protein
MENTQLMTFLEKNLQRQLDWIRAADSKIAPIIAIDTFMLGTLAALTSQITKFNPIILFWEIFAGLLLLIGLTSIFFAVFPRTSGPAGLNIYFGGIVDIDCKTYLEKLKELNDNDYIEDLTRQTHRNAQIAFEKYKFIKYSLRFLFYSILPWLISLLFLNQWRTICH